MNVMKNLYFKFGNDCYTARV